MPTAFYARIANKVYGPFDADKLKKLAAAGKLSRDDAISKDGKTDWKSAGNVKGLFPPGNLPAPAPSEKALPIATIISTGQRVEPFTVPHAPSNGAQVVPDPASSSHVAPPPTIRQPVDPLPVSLRSPSLRRKIRLTAWITGSTLLLVAMVAAIIYFIDPEILGYDGPGRTVLTFVESYNEKDINLMLSQVDSRVERGARAIDKISPLVSSFGINTRNAFKLIPFFATIVGDAVGTSPSSDHDSRRAGFASEGLVHRKPRGIGLAHPLDALTVN